MHLTKNNKMGWRLLDYGMYLHLLFHHLKGLKKKKHCHYDRCPFKGKVYEKKGDIPYVALPK